MSPVSCQHVQNSLLQSSSAVKAPSSYATKSLTVNNLNMESYHISDDRTVSVVKLQDGEKIINMKVNGPFEKSIDLNCRDANGRVCAKFVTSTVIYVIYPKSID